MIKDGSRYVADRLEELKTEKSQRQDQPPPKPLVHPAIANRYRKEVENLKQALDRNDARAEASEHLHALIGKIVLTPEPRARPAAHRFARRPDWNLANRQPETSSARKHTRFRAEQDSVGSGGRIWHFAGSVRPRRLAVSWTVDELS